MWGLRYQRIVIDFIFRYFQPSHEVAGELTLREPGFNFERLVLPDLKNEESEVEFSSLAVSQRVQL